MGGLVCENHSRVVLVEGRGVTLGLARRQGDLLDEVTRFCDDAVAQDSVYALLHRERDNLFPDEFFADLFTSTGRRSVPPSIVATVIVLQKLGGLSDREAVDRFTYDARWRYAAGVGGWDDGPVSFAHTVLVDMRARLRASVEPDRIKRVSVEVAADAGLLGLRRALDSAPLFDAVATQDTVTLVRSAIRALLRVCAGPLAAQVRAVLARDDDYVAAGKPVCDWDDADAREVLIDALVRDGMAALKVLADRDLPAGVIDAVELLATVIGQDIDQDDDGMLRIARRVARDRVISTVDPDARHGHKTSARRYDGYKGHIAADPDSEIITAATVTPANTGDAAATEDLLAEFAPADAATGDAPAASSGAEAHPSADTDTDTTAQPETPADSDADATAQPETPADSDADATAHEEEGDVPGGDPAAHDEAGHAEAQHPEAQPAGPRVYGDAAYGGGDNLELLERLGADAMTKVQPATAPGGRFSKDEFDIDVKAGTVGCPGGQTATIRFRDDGSGTAAFGKSCGDCPLRERCTTSASGRKVTITRHEERLAAARLRQQDPAWQADYRANRPKVERKLAHLVRRLHGGRRARVRGLQRVAQDWDDNVAAHNFARCAKLGVRKTVRGWQAAVA
jgi:hypothetical protein